MVPDKQLGSILTPFNILLGTISNHLTKDDVRQIKVQLQGHLSKECLERLRVGHDVTEVLQQRGIVTDKKLAFLRGLLVGCQQDGLVELVDEFKKSSIEQDGQLKQERVRAQRRLNGLRVIMERQAAEIQNYRSTGDDLKDTLDNKEALLNSHKEVCISQYEDVDVLSELLRTETMDRDMMEERAVESSEVIKLQEAELKNLQQALKNSRLNIKGGSREKRVSVFDKHSSDKSRKSLESLMKQKEDKEETLTKYKQNNEEIEKQLHYKREKVREINLKILEKTKDLVEVDQEILGSFEDIRKARQLMRQNEMNIWDMERELEETQEEYTRTEKTPVFDKPISIPMWRLEEIGVKPHKVLKYDDVLDENSYSFGCYGNRIDPLQFDCPRGIGVTRKDMVFVADHGNCRIHIIDEMGYPIREAITMNSTYPTALAVNKKGNIIISDSQIIKVFTSDGMLSHNFLPMYNKKDEKPLISALTVDKEGHILAADITNHRIQKFRIDGHFIGFIGGPAYLHTPSGIAVTKYGDVVVSEYESHQIKLFHHHGKSYSTFGRPGIGRGQFMNPRGLAIDNKGNILVADSMNHRIQVITMDGQYVSSFGRLGSDRGCLDTPYAVAVNRKGHVFVADSGNHRLSVFT